MAKLFHAGFSNYIAVDKVVSVATHTSAPIKRIVLEARDKGILIDLTAGRKIKSVIFTTSKHIVLSAIETVAITGRIEGFT